MIGIFLNQLFFEKHLKSFEKIFVQDYNSEKVLEKMELRML